ncbi:MAG TPA: CoA transferase [Longimicrobiales bacterium]|nr:CoA transferase [Longimicrobiales bacterium]
MTPPLPLAGLRVVEVAQNLAGPYCARILAELGADVVKVEPPTGDAARSWGPPFLAGEGTIFAFANTGKRSVRLDLGTGEGMAALRSLVARADVLVESLRPGVLAELGMGWDEARSLNGGLIYASVLAYGQEGPLKDLPGYEPLMQAHGGLMSYTGQPGGSPVRVGTSVVDMGTGMWAALGVLAALRERDRTGEGTRISGALFDTALTWSGYHLLGALADGTVARRFGTQLPMIAPYGTFPTSDGEVMVAVGTDPLFARLCGALNLGPLHQDSRFLHNPERVANREELNLKVCQATRRHTAQALLDLLRGAGVPCAPVLDVGEILEDAQFRASGMLSGREAGAGGEPEDTDAPLNTRLPLRWDGERFPVQGPPPGPGAHTREVLEELGLEPRLIRAILGETEG